MAQNSSTSQLKKLSLIVIATILAAFVIYGLGYAFGKLIANMSSDNNSKDYFGASEMVIADGKMTPEVLLSLGRLSDAQLSPDGELILYGVSYNSVAQNRSCRNLFVCNTDGSGKVQLTKSSKSISNARWSGDGKSIYYVMGGQMYKAAFKGDKLGKGRKLSDVPAGIGEFKLSPDESLVIYTSTIRNCAVEQPADSDPALDKAQAYATEDLMYRHWNHWVTEVPRSYVATMGNGTITPDNSIDILGEETRFELPTEPFGGIEQLDWAPDGRHIAYSCRKLAGMQYAFSTNTCIYIYDLLTGETVAVTTEGGYDTDPVWSPDGQHLAWISMPRDGYEADRQRLMVCDFASGEQPADGQSNEFCVSNIRELAASIDRDAEGIFWTPESNEVIFSAMTDGRKAIYKVNADGFEPQVKRLTAEAWDFDFFSPFGYKADENGFTMYASYYCLNFPLELVAVNVPAEGEAIYSQITDENGHLLGQLTPPESECVFVETVDHKQMLCWVLYPPQFDPSKVYPAIEIALGGPQSNCSQDWSYRWCYRLMAEQGYIVIMPNRRGTTAFGQEWKEQISGDYPGLNMQDYLCAGRYIKSQPYVGKLACCGASYGGYSIYMLEGMHGDLYDCFISHAGIFSEKQLWFTTEEMWFANWDGGGLTEYAYEPGQTGPKGDGITFGGMQQAGAPYSTTAKALRHYASAPVENVTKWRTPILCMHGMKDYRIPYEQGMAAFNAAQMMGVPSKLVIFPDECHWILQPQNAIYWYRTYFGWLERWIK